MDRRQFALLLPAAGTAAATLMSCNSEPKVSPLREFLNRKDLQIALENVNTSINKMMHGLDQVNSDNCSDSLENIRDQASDIRDSYLKLQRLLRSVSA
jgi:hypothetical protein